MKTGLYELLTDLEEYFDQRADGEISTESAGVQLNDEARFLTRIQQQLKPENSDEEQ